MLRINSAAVTVQTPVQRFPDLRFVQDVMNDFLVNFAHDAGFTLEVEEDDDDDGQPCCYRTPSPEDCIYAARQPVTIAAVLNDLCSRIGIEPPAAITAALTDAEPS
jgi:hypothetical protein